MPVAQAITIEERALLFPAISKAWEDACSEIEPNNLIDYTFFYPDPDLFRSVQSMDRLRKYVAAWLVIRPYWLASSLSSTKHPQISSTKRWKSLFVAFYAAGGDLKDNISRTSKERRELMEWMGMSSIEPIDPMNFSGVWLGKKISGPLPECIGPILIKQVVWELHELNFTADLKSMHLLHRQLPLDKEMKKAYDLCWPSGEFRGLNDLPFEDDLTLSSPDALTRAGCITSLNNLMLWPDMAFSSHDFPLSIMSSLAVATQYEAKVARYYCLKLWDVMRRKPIPPAIWA